MAAFLWTAGFILLLVAPNIYNWADSERQRKRELREFRTGYNAAMPD